MYLLLNSYFPFLFYLLLLLLVFLLLLAHRQTVELAMILQQLVHWKEQFH